MSIIFKDGTTLNCQTVEKDEDSKMLYCDDFWIVRMEEVEHIVMVA